jgi:Flp pilus assembly protein TadB
MPQLVLLVVAAAWAAVLIPPMLRSRVENRPNSSVTDFRRQLSTLQSTSTPRMRTLGRPLAPSPLQRPAAAGRPGHPNHRQAALHGSTATRQRTAKPRSGETGARAGQPAFRTHGHHDHAHRQTHMERPNATSRPADPRAGIRRRRTNVLFLLVITTACTLFLAATTGSTVMLYVFVLAFLALCGYVYQLAQLRQREASGWDDGWLEQR